MKFLVTDEDEPHLARRKQMLAAKKLQLKSLMQPNLFSIIWIVLFVVAQYLVSFFLAEASWGQVLLMAYIVGAFFSHALFVLIHECSHDLVFKKSTSNRLAALFCDLALIFPTSQAFRFFHIYHHTRMGDYELDADIASPAEAKWVGQSWFRKIIWVHLLGLMQCLRPLRFQKANDQKYWVYLNGFLQTTVVTLILLTVGPKMLVYLMASSFFALGFHPLGGRWIAEHYMFDPLQETYSCYGPVNRVMFNIGYHTEHHDFINIPWNHLPKIKKMFPEMYSNRVFHRSYIQVLLKFIFDNRMSLYSRRLRATGTRLS